MCIAGRFCRLEDDRTRFGSLCCEDLRKRFGLGKSGKRASAAYIVFRQKCVDYIPEGARNWRLGVPACD